MSSERTRQLAFIGEWVGFIIGGLSGLLLALGVSGAFDPFVTCLLLYFVCWVHLGPARTHAHRIVYFKAIVPTLRAVKAAVEDWAERNTLPSVLLHTGRQHRAHADAEELISDFERTVFDEFQMTDCRRLKEDERQELAALLSATTDGTKHEAYPLISEHIFEDESEHRRTIRLILTFCRTIEQADGRELSTNESVHELKQAISRELSGFDFSSREERSLELLHAYGSMRPTLETGEPFSGDELFSPVDGVSDHELWRDFQEYLPFDQYEPLNQQLLTTVVDVVSQGKLDQSAVAEDVDALVERERERVQEGMEEREAYLVLSCGKIFNSGTELEQKLLTRHPNHLDIGGVSNRSDVSDIPDPGMMTYHIIFPRTTFESPEAFKRDLLSIVPDEKLEKGNAFISVLRLSAVRPSFEPDKEVLQEELPTYMKDNLDVIEFLETGAGSRAVTRAAIDNLLGQKIEVKELLAAIPLNVFADMTPQQERVVTENYQELKDEFNVDDLYDWCRIDHADLAERLSTLDEENEATDDEWELIAADMIDSATDCRDAARSQSRSQKQTIRSSE